MVVEMKEDEKEEQDGKKDKQKHLDEAKSRVAMAQEMTKTAKTTSKMRKR